jgi:Tfp pilus assembly protein PilX
MDILMMGNRHMSFTACKTERYGSYRAQRGTIIFLTLIALVIMTLAGLALIRTVDTTNLIAGNFAFKQAALQSSDTGIEAGFADLPTFLVNAGTDAPPYYSVFLGNDANGLPSTLPNGNPFTWSGARTATNAPSGYTVQYVIDRLCQAGTTSANIGSNCFAGVSASSGSHKPGAPVFSSVEQVYYRISVRVGGPRNTVSYAQAIVTP